MQAARDRQKSYADLKRKPMEFQVGDKVMLKVSPWKGVVRFRKQGKLNPRSMLDSSEALSSSEAQGSVLDTLRCVLADSLTVALGGLYAIEHPKCYVCSIGG
ncbi:hypothetical protein Tco_0618538 [Tanacetum coccineum]